MQGAAVFVWYCYNILLLNFPSGPLLRNVHWGGKSRQKGQFLLNRVALCCNTSRCFVSPNRKIIAFWKKGTFSGVKQARVGGQIWGLGGQLPPTLYVKRGPEKHHLYDAHFNLWSTKSVESVNRWSPRGLAPHHELHMRDEPIANIRDN